MEFGGKYRIGLARFSVWEGLNSTEILQATIPGCRSIAYTAPDKLALTIGVRLGIVGMDFSGDLVLSDVMPAQSYILSGQGRGRVLGLAHGSAKINLSDDGVGTILGFAATAGASDKIMRLGRKVVGASAQRVIDGFFVRFAEAMGAELEILGADIAGN